jgi:hypothetical protein
MWDMRNAYDILVGKPEGKKPFDRPRNSWQDIIEMNIKQIV